MTREEKFKTLDNIADSKVRQDIADTQKEIDDYSAELLVLERNPVENRIRIYTLQGRISKRDDFNKKLNDLLEWRAS